MMSVKPSHQSNFFPSWYARCQLEADSECDRYIFEYMCLLLGIILNDLFTWEVNHERSISSTIVRRS